MEFAINTIGDKIDASSANKNEKYFCPICNQIMILRQGKTNIDHFAHKTKCTDNWHYDMSEWHSQWQAQFPLKNREVVVDYLGEKHRADVMACGYVIEFQHSSITAEEFEERNKFYRSYGKKVVWIFDVIDDFREGRMVCYGEWNRNNDNGGKYRWQHPKRFLLNFIPQKEKDIIVFFQVQNEDHTDEELCYIERVTWAIDDDYMSDFSRFFTSYYPANAIELLDWIKNRKL